MADIYAAAQRAMVPAELCGIYNRCYANDAAVICARPAFVTVPFFPLPAFTAPACALDAFVSAAC